MSLSRDITKFFDKSSKKRDQSDQSKEGNSGDEPKNIREEKSSIDKLSEKSNDVFAKSVISPACVVLAKSTQEQQIKGEKQLNDLHTLSNLFMTNSKNMRKIG